VDCLQQLIGSVQFLNIVHGIDSSDHERIGPRCGPKYAALTPTQIFNDLRTKLDKAAVGIVSPRHESIVAIADAHNLTAKLIGGQDCAGHDSVDPRHATAACIDSDAMYRRFHD
jgi:hypothetical protein